MPRGIYERTEELKKQLSESHKGYKMPESQKNKISKANKGKPKSEEHKINAGLASGNARKGNKYPNMSHIHSVETKKRISKNRKGKYVGKDHWNWLGGLWKNPYPKEFNPSLKLKIRTRDKFICCLCGKSEREELDELNRALCVNHIDFNKNNCNEENLNTLCQRCNIKINREREYFTNYFQTN